MQFGSLFFIFVFLPVFLLFNSLIIESRRALFYIISGFLFYFANAGSYLTLLIITILVNYLVGLLIELGFKKNKNHILKLSFLFGILFNIGFLFYFKYLNFFLDNFGSFLNIPQTKNTIVNNFPIGISFFTFLALSYLIDIYRKTSKPSKNIIEIGLYISFFPKILMGPITLYNDFEEQLKLKSSRKIDYYYGIKRFIIGLGKKVLIADSMAKIANPIFDIGQGEHTVLIAWIGAISYTIQIYFDFSGYSDMVIGISKMLGFDIPENFNYPYISQSIKEFWKRWHITLAKWLQTYLFLPIAYLVMRKIKTNKFLLIKTENFAYFVGSFFTMLICGIWHGANWTFIVWGIYYGLILIIEHGLIGKFLKKKTNKSFRIFYSLILIIIGWVIFRSNSLSYAFDYILSMFGFGNANGDIYYPALYLNKETIFFVLLGIIGSFPVIPKFSKIIFTNSPENNIRRNILKIYSETFLLLAVFVLSIITITANTYTPFIYANF